MIPTPRPYQAAGIIAIRAHALAGRRRACLSLPTAGGKTIIAAAIIHSARTNFDARVLFVAPLVQLVNQAAEELQRWDVGGISVLRADDPRFDPDARVTVASVQTLARRDRPPADIVIIDEAHRASADIYQRAIFAAYPDAVIIGLSATPANLGGVFDCIEPAATYAELIADKFIAEPICYGAPRGADLSAVKTTGGDYNAEQLEAAMLRGNLIGDIVEQWKKLGRGHRTVVFAVGIAHSLEIARRFNAEGIPCEHIDGTTPDEQRRACLRRLDDGHTRVVSNAGVLTEGWNQPSVRCCVLARPTKSLVLYKQMVGRILRVHADGQPVVIDHAGNIDAHGQPHEDIEWTLTEAKRKPKAEYRICKQCFAWFVATSRTCPECGWEAPLEPRKPPVELSSVALELKQRLDERRRFYDVQVGKARSRGFKPGFAAAKFKEKFGDWPPWDWSQTTKGAFASDASWQANYEYHQREKEHWAEVDAQLKAKESAEEFEVEENCFADLLR